MFCWGSDSYGESSAPVGEFTAVGAFSKHRCRCGHVVGLEGHALAAVLGFCRCRSVWWVGGVEGLLWGVAVVLEVLVEGLLEVLVG